MGKKVIVIGGGVAGMNCAISLKKQGVEPLIIEREDSLGGNVKNWHRLFPTFTPVAEVLNPLKEQISQLGIEVMYNTEVEKVSDGEVTLKGGKTLKAESVVVCSGFNPFDAVRKEEYGYGIYDNVFTSTDIERMFNEGKVATAQGQRPKRVAILHCVGSRDEKVGNRHCSKVCCITGVKQAIEIKKMFPECEVYNFYMDIRMFGPGYEELYRQAQVEYNIHFIRGRISEASQTIDGRVQIKSEDTLVGTPLKMSVDMLILLVGMEGGKSNCRFADATPALELACNGFMASLNPFNENVCSKMRTVYYAGTVTAPKNIGESLSEGALAACQVAANLR